MRDALPAIHAAGAELVVVGNGTPAQAGYFREDTGLTSPLYTDPSLASYKAAGMKYGAGLSRALQTAAHAVRAVRKGFVQKRTMGNPWQQGGVLVIDRGGAVRFAFASGEAGDHPPLEDVLAALPRE